MAYTRTRWIDYASKTAELIGTGSLSGVGAGYGVGSRAIRTDGGAGVSGSYEKKSDGTWGYVLAAAAGGGISAGDATTIADTEAAAAVAAHVAASDPHPTYTTAAELTSALSGKADTSSLAAHATRAIQDADIPASIARDSEVTAAVAAVTTTSIGAIPTTQKGAASGVASLDGSTKVPLVQLPTGTTSTTVALGDAAANAVTAHVALSDPHSQYALDTDLSTHAANASHLTANQQAAIAGTSGTAPSGTNKLVDNADTRLTNARTPTAHAASHATGGGDPITPASIGAEPAITTLGVAKGGTGLGAVGASGNVLTSNGTAWVSQAPTGGSGLPADPNLDRAVLRWNDTTNAAEWAAGAWEYLGGVAPLGAAAATMGAVTIAARDELMVVLRITSMTGGVPALRFNGDTANNYNSRVITMATGVVTLVNNITSSTPMLRVSAVAQTLAMQVVTTVMNHQGTEKLAVSQVAKGVNAATSTSPLVIHASGSWVNTAAQITSVQALLDAAGNYGIGSAMAIFGRNFTT